jgi:enoyl-CoA hydratase
VEYQEIAYAPGQVARIVLNRPAVRNAQSWRLREELDHALALAERDDGIGAVVLSGAGGTFSAGHDIGTPQDRAYRAEHGHAHTDHRGRYFDTREINVENTLRWRRVRKPTIAMVDGYCIFGGWMIAAAMDVVFAAESCLFLPGLTQYFSVPWDIGHRKAKEVIFEHRFMPARECMDLGFVNRVYPDADLERETLAYAARVAANYLADPLAVEQAKLAINQAQDAQGFTPNIESAYNGYFVARGMAPRARVAPQAGGVARTGIARANLDADAAWLAARHGGG